MNTSPIQKDADDIRTTISRQLASLWSWIFLVALVVIFELWARIADGSSFVFNAYNVQSILIFAASPLLLGLGQTLVIIAGGIDLSVGFIMGFSSIVMAQVMRNLGVDLPPGMAIVAGVAIALTASSIPGLINGYLIARLGAPAENRAV